MRLRLFKSTKLLSFLFGFHLTFIPIIVYNGFLKTHVSVDNQSPHSTGVLSERELEYSKDDLTVSASGKYGDVTEYSMDDLNISASGRYGNITKPENLTRIQTVWQLQEGKYKIFLYTAFYDDRPGLDSPHIRVISVAEKYVNNISCLIWHKDRTYPYVVNASKSDIGQQINRGSLQFRQNLFSCKISVQGTYKPDYVSIVTALQPKPTNAIKIHYPHKPPANEVLEFGHCLSVLYLRGNDPQRIVEWIELMKLMGVEEFNVYASSLNSSVRHVFQNYPAGTAINFNELPNVMNDSHRNSMRLSMSSALTDCLYRNMYRYKYIVCTDTDEVIVPLLDDNYSDMIKRINKKHKVKHPYPSYEFRNVYFFTDLGPVNNESNILHTQRYFRHVKPSNAGYSPKSISSPFACAGLQNHYCWQRVPSSDYQGWTTWVDKSIGMSFHFKKCHFDEYLHRPGECAKIMTNHTVNDRMKHFSGAHTAVHNALTELKMI